MRNSVEDAVGPVRDFRPLVPSLQPLLRPPNSKPHAVLLIVGFSLEMPVSKHFEDSRPRDADKAILKRLCPVSPCFEAYSQNKEDPVDRSQETIAIVCKN